VRDAYWLQAYWELSQRSVERARAAMAEQWHTARPVLRLFEVDRSATGGTVDRPVRDIDIHGGVQHWYVDVKDPPQDYRVAVGYLASDGKFYPLVRSNSVTTPRPDGRRMVDHNWADVVDDCDKIFAMSGGYRDEAGGDLKELFEERLQRPIGSPMVTRYGNGAERVLDRPRDFLFKLDAEMIVFGATRPDAYVTLAGEPLRLRPDGTFTARVPLLNRRQVLPVVSSSANGMEQHTIVLAVERNTKTMEPVFRDATTCT